MKKVYTLLLSLAVVAAATAAVPFQKGKPEARVRKATVSYARAKAPQATELLNENFAQFADGTEAAPGAEVTYVDGYHIPDNMTATPGWTGQGVCPAGGAVALRNWTDDYDQTRLGYISTPPMNQAGTVTLTFRAKARTSGGALWIAACDDYYGPGKDQWDLPLSPAWKEYTLVAKDTPLDEYSYFQFQAEGGEVLLDDVRISIVRDRLAAPYAKDAENLSTTKFKASWEGDAPAYSLNVYSVVANENAEEGEAMITFDNLDASAASTTMQDGTYVTFAGEKTRMVDGDFPCVVFDLEGDTLLTAPTPEPLTELSLCLIPEGDDSQDEYMSLIRLEIHHAVSDSWEVIAQLPASWIYNEEYNVVPEALGEDADRVRISMIQVGTAKFMLGGVMMKYKNHGIREDIVKDLKLEANSYEVEMSNPAANYYYYVKAVDGDIVSPMSNVVWVDGVRGLKVEALDPVELKENSFTAAWKPLGHATEYTVESYRSVDAKADMPGTVIVAENFDGITDGKVDQPVNPWTGTHDFGKTGQAKTSWGATQPCWAEGMAGTTGTAWWSGKAGLIYSPLLDLSSNKGTFTVEATVHTTVPTVQMANGTTEPEGVFVLVMDDLSANTAIMGALIETPTVGKTTGTVTMQAPEGVDMSKVYIAFMNKSGQTFFLDEATIKQDIKAGDKFTAPHGITSVPETSCKFENLDGAFDYAYAVTAKTSYNFTDYVSERSDLKYVKLSSGVDAVEAAADEAPVYYNLQGMRQAQPLSPGIYIVRQGGKASKVVVR